MSIMVIVNARPAEDKLRSVECGMRHAECGQTDSRATGSWPFISAAKILHSMPASVSLRGSNKYQPQGKKERRKNNICRNQEKCSNPLGGNGTESAEVTAHGVRTNYFLDIVAPWRAARSLEKLFGYVPRAYAFP